MASALPLRTSAAKASSVDALRPFLKLQFMKSSLDRSESAQCLANAGAGERIRSPLAVRQRLAQMRAAFTAQPTRKGIDAGDQVVVQRRIAVRRRRSEEHTSELQSLMRISYAVFCLKKKKKTTKH